jgi:hypothetical protein
MPGTTDVTASVVANGAANYTLGTPSDFAVPCSAAAINAKDGSTVFTFNVTTTTPGTGTFTLTVTTPSKLATTVQIPIG